MRNAKDKWERGERHMDMMNVLEILNLSCVIGISQVYSSTVLYSALLLRDSYVWVWCASIY
jgi:hypothetical protein